jgi:exonuclease SbcC
MSLLEQFSKPRWQHPKPEVRLAAIDEIDDPAVLLEVLQTDEDPGVQARALSRIESGETLDRLIDEPPDTLPVDLLRQARAQRLGQILSGDGSLPDGANDALLVRITNLADEPALIESAIGSIRDPQIRIDIAASHPVARTRLIAAQSISDVETLQGLMQLARHKDKSVFRHCRERIDQHLAAERTVEEQRQKLAQLADDAAALRAAVDSPDYRPRFLSLQQRWEGLRERAAEEERERIQGDLDTCARRVQQKAAELAAEEQEQAAAVEAGQTFEDLLGQLADLDPAALTTPEAAGALEAQLNGIEERWVAALRHAQPDPGQTEACKALLSQWRALLLTLRHLAGRKGELGRFFKDVEHLDPADFRAIQKSRQHAGKLARALPWPDELVEAMPEPIGKVREQRDLLDQRLEVLQKKEQKTLEKVEKAFEAFGNELATNHFRNADRALNRLRNLLRQLSPARQDHYQNELKPLQARLQEIHDWQGFAIEPKKAELIEQMRALVGSTEDADTLAAKIKALQDEWKQLGPLAPRRDQELWQAFRSAADEAWAPCKEAFEQRAEVRKEIYRQRMQLVAQLIEYEKKIAWPDLENPDPELPEPDWKMVRKTLNAARKAFGELGHVDRKQERKSQKALDKVCNRIYAHLEQEYGRNIERKKALIEEAKALVEAADLKPAIERAKAIQREWKGVGLTPQRLDRPLWKEFRKTCDAIFARLGEERNQRTAEARARAEQRQANERARAEQAEQKKKQRQERWQKLLDRMQACALKPNDPEKAAALWDEDERLPDDIDAEALEAWWQSGPGDDDVDALREACIALEVLAGIDSPAEEKQARMAYQMKRLVEGMGSGQGDGRERLLETINRFISLRPSAEWVGRFCSTVEAARAMVR